MKRMILVPVIFILTFAAAGAPMAQQASQNIPVLPVIPQFDEDGVEDPAWYLKGDGYLQRQVEPTIAVSTRNPDHVLSFFVDYRAVNIQDDVGLGEATQTLALALEAADMMLAGMVSFPEVPVIDSPPIAAAEAWVGGSASHDGGLTWTGFMMPGASFDHSLLSEDSPVFGLEAATDPVAVAGPCGYVYVSFMAFTRGDMSKLVVARFQDLNDSESGRTWQYQGAWELESGNNATNGYFLDKPHIALDVFREESDLADYGQYYPAGENQCGHRVYVSYSTFNGLDKLGKFQSKLNFATSADRGETWTKSRIQQPYTQNQGSFIAVDPRPGTPATTGGGRVYVIWRHFFSPDTIVMIKTADYGKKFSKPVELTGGIPMAAFDQPTQSAWDGEFPPSPDYLTARANAFPTAAVTGDGTVFVAWQEKVDGSGFPDPSGSPRIVMVKSTNGGDSWSALDGSDTRFAVDIGERDAGCDPDDQHYPGGCQQPPGFGVLPQERPAGPQIKPWLSYGGGKLALAYSEARGPLSDETGYISGIDQVVDFRVALLDPATGELQTTQVSRYPIRGDANLSDGEQISDIAPVEPYLCADNPGTEYCQPALNFYNKNHSGAGTVPFMGDYPGMSPIVSLINRGGTWRWANDPEDVPYQAFQVVFPDNRHLIPPTYPPGWDEWESYPFYDFPPTDEYSGFECVNPGSRNTDVLTAKVNGGLVLSAPTTYKMGSPGDPTWGYPITVFNQSGSEQFFQLEITQGTGVASFIVDDSLVDPGVQDDTGFVQIFPYSSTSQMVYVEPGATEQIRIKVQGVDCEVETDPVTGEPVIDDNGEYSYDCGVPDGELGYVTLNPDPSNPDAVAFERQNLVITKEAVEEYEGNEAIDALNPFVRNPFVRNPFVRNPFVRNPFVRNTAIDDQTQIERVIDTTWSVQATEDSGAGSYLPVINIDNAEQFVGNYAFQLLIYKNASNGAFEGCETINSGNPVMLSSVSQDTGAANPFVRNPFVRNPFVRNPFVRNPFVRNSAITVAPSDGVVLEKSTTSSATPMATKNLIDEDGVLRVPRLPEMVFITLRAFQLQPDGTFDFVYDPNIDEPALSMVPTRCTNDDCIQSLAPNLVPTSFSGVPSAVAPGDTIPVDLELQNQGTLEAEAENRDLRHGVYFSTDAKVEFGPDNDEPIDGDTLVSEALVTETADLPFAAGATDSFDRVALTIPEDGFEAGETYYLVFVVDDYREVSESNETDNQLAVAVRINTPPIAADASFTTDEDTPLTESLLDCENGAGACDPDGDTLVFTVVDHPSDGNIEFNAEVSGEFTYIPDFNFNGTDTFTYSVSDGNATSEVATVTILVTPVDDYVFDGFFNPWTEDPAYTANAGSAIPLKWRYLDRTGTQVEDSGAFDPSIESTFYPDDSGTCPGYDPDLGTTREISLDPDDPGSSDLRYDSADAEWQLNWATPDVYGCYYLRVFNNLEGLGGEVSEPMLIILR